MSLIIASTHGEIPNDIHGADLLEIRIDGLEDAASALPDLLARSPIPTIVTCRSVSEGGMFEGEEEERVALYRIATASGHPPRYLDIEYEALTKHPLLLDSLSNTETGVILSWHAMTHRPKDLFQRAADMQDVAGVDIVKIVWRARSIRDNLDAFEILRTKQQPLIVMCMGEYGLMSRVLASKFGGFATYAAVEGHEPTAPHQPTVQTLQSMFRFKELNKQTKVYGIIGSHVSSSASPAFHNRAFAEAGVNAVYLPLSIPPEWEQLKASFLELFHNDLLQLAGASVTIPHKEHVFKLIKSLSGQFDDISLNIGAVNTVAQDDSGLRATNTDVLAISQLLNTSGDVLILGAGGVARAAVVAMATQDATPHIAARNPEQIKCLTDALPCTLATQEMDAFDAIINCTPIGMKGGGDPDGDPLLELAPQVQLSDQTIVFDTVYAPADTPFIQRATAHGCQTILGKEMFALQARLQQEWWNT